MNRDHLRTRLAWHVLPPAFAFLAARVLLWAVAAHLGVNALSTDSWSFCDSDHYLSVAERGYELFPCENIGYGKPGWWCGNAGWFPGYSWLIRLGTMAGLRPAMAGVILSAGFALASLSFLWIAWLESRPRASSLLALVLAAVFPGMVYAHGVYPNSMFVFLVLIFLHAIARNRFMIVAVSGFLAGLTYSSSFMLALVATSWGLASPTRAPWRRRIAHAFMGAAPVTLGVFAVFLVQRISTGAWNAYFLVQGKYDVGLHNPLVVFARKFSVMGLAPVLQMVFVALLTITLVVATAWRHRARPVESDQRDWLIALHGLVLWLVPLTQGGQISIYRTDLALLPLVLLARHLPIVVQGFMVASAATVAVLLGESFFLKLIQ